MKQADGGATCGRQKAACFGLSAIAAWHGLDTSATADGQARMHPIVRAMNIKTDGKRSCAMADMISGIKIPDSNIARQAAELVRQHESEMLFNHSVRVYVFGAMRGIREALKFDSELLYVAALFHDLGLVDAYHTQTKRFEVDGADAAREFLRSHGIPEPKADLVWEAIALHTTPGIPEYMRPEIALTRAGVAMDVVGVGYDEYTSEQRVQTLAAFPRGDFKREFVQDQLRSALKKPETTFGTVNVEYIEHFDHTFCKPNVCMRIHDAPWQS
ncbi:HD domain-containing protein [Methylobacterium sp. CM6257]